MNFDIMSKAMERGAEFSHATHFAEIFDNPLMHETEDGDPVEGWEHLFERSEWGGIFVPTSNHIDLIFKDDKSEATVSVREFVAWQLLHASNFFVYYVINKVGGSSIARDLYENFDNDEPQSWNGDELPEYWVSDAEGDWLVEYNSDSLDQGISFIQRCKEEKPIEFAFKLADYILDGSCSLTNNEWYETDLIENFDERSNYDNWSVKIMCVATGKFFTEIESGFSQVMMRENKVFSYCIRNYDED